MGTSVTMMRQGKVAIPYMARAASKHNICGKQSLTLLTCLPCARLAATVGFRTRLLSVGVYTLQLQWQLPALEEGGETYEGP